MTNCLCFAAVATEPIAIHQMRKVRNETLDTNETLDVVSKYLEDEQNQHA